MSFPPWSEKQGHHTLAVATSCTYNSVKARSDLRNKTSGKFCSSFVHFCLDWMTVLVQYSTNRVWDANDAGMLISLHFTSRASQPHVRLSLARNSKTSKLQPSCSRHDVALRWTDRPIDFHQATKKYDSTWVFTSWSVVLLRFGQLPFASQLGWLGPLQHGANINQTQLWLSLLRCKSRAGWGFLG